MPKKAKSIYDEYTSFYVRKAQKVISGQGDVADEEAVRQWLYKNYPKKKKPKEEGSLLTHGVPQ